MTGRGTLPDCSDGEAMLVVAFRVGDCRMELVFFVFVFFFLFFLAKISRLKKRVSEQYQCR